jgi:hypothetical protein
MLTLFALQIQRDFSIDAARMYRAAEIVNRRGVRKCSATNERYVVQSQSRCTSYIVDFSLVQCGCKDCQRGHVCKHFVAVVMFREMSKPIIAVVQPQTVSQAVDALIASAGLAPKKEKEMTYA